MRMLLSLLFASMITGLVHAGGPKKIAKSDRSLWPYAINTPAEFDFASKMEMLVFARVLQTYEAIVIEDSLKRKLGLQRINAASITTWKANTKNLLLTNFGALKQSSAHDFMIIAVPRHWDQVIAAATRMTDELPVNLKKWFANANDFYDGYLYEQMRLAALFPKTTSEILTLSPSEVNGSGYADKQFLLTFDDGPTAPGGNTDKLTTTLAQHHMGGVFFVLGDMLAARVKKTSVRQVRALYSAAVVGSHGKVHHQHTKIDAWESSISYTHRLIDSVLGEQLAVKYFRPPYGQRHEKIIYYLDQHDTRVMLWNIDSQDWNATIASRQVADRVTTLMLLWRRGIILFHDIHPKANVALPIIWDGLKGADIHWTDVKKLSSRAVQGK